MLSIILPWAAWEFPDHVFTVMTAMHTSLWKCPDTPLDYVCYISSGNVLPMNQSQRDRCISHTNIITAIKMLL